MPKTAHENDFSQRLRTLAIQEIGCNGTAISDEGSDEPGIISVLSSRSVVARCDIPAAFEAYAGLLRALDEAPARALNTDERVPNAPGVYWLSDPDGSAEEKSHYVTCVVDIEEGMLKYVAYWLTENLLSDRLAELPGTLKTLFEIRRTGNQEHLFPEWFAVFCDQQGGSFPLLAYRSILEDERFGNWAQTACERMPVYRL